MESRGTLWAIAAMIATCEDIDATMSDQRPPCKPPDSPHCYARYLKVPGTHKEAMRSDHPYLWKGSPTRGVLRIAGGRDV